MKSRNIFLMVSFLLYFEWAHSEVSYRLIGGKEVVDAQDIASTRHVVYLLKYAKYACTGALISAQHVITAAYCVQFTPKYKKQMLPVVVAGLTNLKDEGGQRRQTRDKFYPKEYNSVTKIMDICILKVDKPFKENDMVKIISLYKNDKNERWYDLQKGQSVEMQVSSWGSTDQQRLDYVQKLRTGTMRELCWTECKKELKLRGIKFTQEMICTENSEVDTCFMDYGAPAVVDNQLYAVATTYAGCVPLKAPAIFTALANEKVRAFVDDCLKK